MNKKILVIISAIILSCVALLFTAVDALFYAKPGEALYPLGQNVQDLVLGFASSPSGKAQIALEIATNNLKVLGANSMINGTVALSIVNSDKIVAQQLPYITDPSQHASIMNQFQDSLQLQAIALQGTAAAGQLAGIQSSLHPSTTPSITSTPTPIVTATLYPTPSVVPAGETYVYGQVSASPSMPVCRIGTSCSAPLAHLAFSFDDATGKSFQVQTDGNGNYGLLLPQGNYTVNLSTYDSTHPGAHQTYTLLAQGKYVLESITLDSGLR